MPGQFATEPVHRKLVFPRSAPPVLRDYANLYRFGVPAGPAPLLVYIGGQISLETHAERFDSEPTFVVDELCSALRGDPVRRLDFLVTPSPPVPRPGFDNHAEDFAEFFGDVLLPALESPAPSAIGFVAFSYGAFLATYVALGLEGARALITLGEAGVARAVSQALPIVPHDILVELYRNEGDPGQDPVTVARSFPGSLRARVMPLRPGVHRFADYAKNGTVADAFRSGLRAIMTR